MVASNLVATPEVTIEVVNGVPSTTSLDIAKRFGKQHRDVLRAIEGLMEQIPEEYRLRNFAQTVVKRENPSGGAPIESPAFIVTRDGFTLLAMGFTGAKAIQFKMAYINKFNELEKTAQTLALQNDPTYKLGLLVKNTINPEATNRLGLAIPWAGQPPQKQKMTKALKEFLQTPRRQLTEIEFGIIVNMLARA